MCYDEMGIRGLGMGLKARCVLLSTVSALALSSPASAQDIWTGFYVGGHGGIGWVRNEQTITSNVGIFTCSAVVSRANCEIRDTGAVFGGQAGYNWQLQQWVFGVEADGSWTCYEEDVGVLSVPPRHFFSRRS